MSLRLRKVLRWSWFLLSRLHSTLQPKDWWASGSEKYYAEVDFYSVDFIQLFSQKADEPSAQKSVTLKLIFTQSTSFNSSAKRLMSLRLRKVLRWSWFLLSRLHSTLQPKGWWASGSEKYYTEFVFYSVDFIRLWKVFNFYYPLPNPGEYECHNQSTSFNSEKDYKLIPIIVTLFVTISRLHSTLKSIYNLHAQLDGENVTISRLHSTLKSEQYIVKLPDKLSQSVDFIQLWKEGKEVYQWPHS